VKTISSLRRFRSLLAISALACPMLASSSHAALIAYDSFDTYTPGADLNGNNGGTGFTSAWSANTIVDVVNGGLSYNAGNVQVNGGSNAVSINGALAGPTDNTFSRAFTGQSSTVYVSFLFQPVVNGGLGQDDFFQFMLNDDTDSENSGTIGMRNQSGTIGNDGYFVRIRDNTADLGNPEAGVLSVLGRTDFLIGKFSVSGANGANFDKFDLFINPTSNTEGAPNATLTGNSVNALIDFFTLRTAFLDTLDAYRFDELRIGTAFADVVPIIPEVAPIVPEPATMTLAGLGLLALASRRKRMA